MVDGKGNMRICGIKTELKGTKIIHVQVSSSKCNIQDPKQQLQSKGESLKKNHNNRTEPKSMIILTMLSSLFKEIKSIQCDHN